MMKYAQLNFYEFFRYDLQAGAQIGGPKSKNVKFCLNIFLTTGNLIGDT